MRRRMDVILAVFVTCSLILTPQHSMLAQVKSKQEAKEVTPRKGDQAERKMKVKGDIKGGKTQTSGLERYRAIIQNNLFMPLGSGGEVKREEFALIGIIGRSALIQMEGSGKSFYVVEGQSFGDDVKLVRVGEDSVTIFYEGSNKELELVSGTPASQDRDTKGGKSIQRQNDSGKSNKEKGSANRSEKGRRSGGEKESWDEGEKKGGDNSWARKMSIDELREVRGEIAEHIEGLRAKGVTDPEEYEGALEKMEVVERAMAEKEASK